LLGVKVKGSEFDFTESAEEVEGGGLDRVFFGDFEEGGVDVRIFGQCAHEDTGRLRVDVLDSGSHSLQERRKRKDKFTLTLALSRGERGHEVR
jgi:hypothetical protein